LWPCAGCDKLCFKTRFAVQGWLAMRGITGMGGLGAGYGRWLCVGVAAAAVGVAVALGLAPAGRAVELQRQLRRPVALCVDPAGDWLYVACRESGTLCVVDLHRQEVAAEHRVGQRLADVQWLPGTRKLLAVDEAAHELLVLLAQGREVQVVSRVPVSAYPVTVLAAPDGMYATVASLWSRRLARVDLDDVPRVRWVLDLPIAPRGQLWLQEHGRLLVADAFGGRLALVDPGRGVVADWRQLPAHNIRGLGLARDGQLLLVAHQMLNDLAHSIRNDIHWGLLMSNDLRWLKVESLLAGGDRLYRGGHMHPLGDAGRGGADPGGLAVAPDGTVVVALSGVHEVAFGKEEDFSMQRRKVGRRPTAVAIDPQGRWAFVANTLDDSLSLLDLTSGEVTQTVVLGPAPPLTLAQRGELLFYDARLSHDGWMSCHSCHTDGHSNAQMNDNFSDRSFNSPKRVLPLGGVKETLPLAWNGQVASLRQQIQNSVTGTMQRDDPLPKEEVEALVAYLQTLEPPPPLDVARGAVDPQAVARGQAVFQRHDCARCHTPPTYTSPEAYDVGLADSQGARRFNPPSLRGVSQRDRWLHDSRAQTLEEVFLLHGHPSDTAYSAEEVRDLVAFLRTL
jgi:cytochrome c peroxidase